LAARLVIIDYMKKWIIPIVIVVVLAVALSMALRRGGKAYNVLLISVDTLRPDHLGCYGYEPTDTRNVDGIAEDGFLFTQAHATVPLTLPSHTSLLSGMSPISTGVRDNGAFVLPGHFVTLAEALKAEGYSTAAFVSTFVIDSRFGLDQGFDLYDDRMETGASATGFYFPERTAEHVNEPAVEWLGAAQEPFFAFVHYYDPHLPYTPPAPYDSLYADALYDGEVAYTDVAIGEILDTLREAGTLDNTLIVFVSDHGEGLGDHDESGHGTLVYEPTIKVALIVRLPSGEEAGDGGRTGRIDNVVSLIDVKPTVLDFLGIEDGARTDGVSLMPLLRGERIEPRLVFFESLYPYFNFKWSPLRGVRHNEWKYILAPREELYNIARDPGEQHNLAEAESERTLALRANVIEEASREAEALESAERSMSQDEVQKLMALGYLSGGRPTLPANVEPEGMDPKDMIKPLGELLWGGRGDFDRRNFEAAAEKFARFAEMDPENPQGHIHLAKALMELGRDEESEAAFKRALTIDSTHSGGLFPLAAMARNKGDLDRALFYLQVGAQTAPGTPEVQANIGGLLVEKGLPDSAIAVLTRALEEDEYDRTAMLNLGLAYTAKRQTDEAMKWFFRTLEIDPKNVKALANIANYHIANGRVDSTIVYLKRAHLADPYDAKMLANLGNAYRQKGMVAEAGGAFQRAVELDPENVMALYGLAAVRAQEGNKEESEALLRRILQINPNFSAAQNALDAISSQ
jgi:arylsulfatase A-like enzyme/Tfp pilus assembly protein PilF